VRLEGLGQLKKSNYLIGNLTRDLPDCTIVPQPTTLPRAPCKSICNMKTMSAEICFLRHCNEMPEILVHINNLRQINFLVPICARDSSFTPSKKRALFSLSFAAMLTHAMDSGKRHVGMRKLPVFPGSRLRRLTEIGRQ
jgi:hypothetical protein